MGKILLVCGFFAAVCGLYGCEQVDRESLNKLAQSDPSFKQMLLKKEGLDSRITLFSNQLQDEKTRVFANIMAMQEDLNKYKQDVESKIAVLKKEMDPERARIKEKIGGLIASVAAKKSALRDLEGTRRNLTSLINQQKAVNVTSEDMKKWQERLTALNEQIEPLKGNVRELEEEIRTLRLKLAALRQ